MLGDVLLEPMRSALYRHALNEHYWRECRIVIAELGDDAGLIGAGALAMESGRGQGSGRE
jgi:glucokinase